MRLGMGSHANYKVDVSIKVVFEGIPAVARKEVISTLNFIADETARITDVIETETREIIAARI